MLPRNTSSVTCKLPIYCNILARNLSERKKSRGPPKPYSTREPRQYKIPFNVQQLHEEGVSWNKMLGDKEVELLSYMANHRHKTQPTVITDRVHDIAEVVPGVQIGPKFFDFETGDTTAEGHEDAAIINNFLHLTPPMIKYHTAELKKLTTPTPPRPNKCIRQYTTNYLYPGPSIKHPLSRDASIRVNIKDLQMDPETEEYFREMITANQNLKLKDIKHYEHYRVPKIFRDLPVVLELTGDTFTIHAKQCPTRKQNLSLCYYRLSGFMQEALALKPVHEEFHLSSLFTDFVFDEKEENIAKFEEKNFVKFHRNEEGDVTGITGSCESIAQAKQLILEISSDVTAASYVIPAPYRDYVKGNSRGFQDVLDANEAIYSADKLVTFSDTIENVKEEVSRLIEGLSHYTVPCPAKHAQFVLEHNFLRNVAKDYDAQAVHGNEDVITVTVPTKHRAVFTTLLNAQIKTVSDSVVTQDVVCSEDIDWDKLSVQFNAHVSISADKTTVTAEPDIVKDISYFIKLKENFKKDRGL